MGVAEGSPLTDPVPLGDGYELHPLSAGHVPALAAAYRRNAEHLAPYEPRRSPAFFTEEGQASVVAGQLTSVADGHTVAWVLTSADEVGRVVGRLNLNNVVRGALWSAALGYWVDVRHQGRGLATRAVEAGCAAARAMGLHRVEAGTLVHNTASQRVLEKAGFERYGLAPRYLHIAGAWQDHVLFQRLLHDEPR